jgi:tetratricopeptide (TPR) repeat protein
MNKLEDARQLADGVLKEDDRSAPAHLVLARAALERGHPAEALPDARRAATLSDLPAAHLILGRTLEQLSKLDQAVAEYQLARRPPVEADATLGRARILVRMGATRDALAELNGLIRDNKLRAQALVLAGDCYSDLQQAEKARHSYEDAVKYGPQLGEAAFKLARSLHDAGRRKPSIDMFERALKLGGDQATYAAESYLLLGDAHRESHANANAVRAYKRYLELAPPDAPARSEVNRHITLLGGT